MIGEGNFSLAFLKLSMSSQEEEDILIAPMEKMEQNALYYAIQGFVGKWWNGSDLYPDPCGWTPIQALPNQQTVDYPSFKLVIVGDGGADLASPQRTPKKLAIYFCLAEESTF
ncbi:hypothetical protein ACSBR1_004975 [Camellia fascicularis]